MDSCNRFTSNYIGNNLECGIGYTGYINMLCPHTSNVGDIIVLDNNAKLVRCYHKIVLCIENKENRMAAPVNRQDIVDIFKYFPSAVFDIVMINILRIDMSIYDNVKELKELKDKIMDYLGVRLNPEGKLEPKSELDKVAREDVQHLIDLYYSSSYKA